jgi:polyisoprenoid-binding protein YceI
MNNKLVYLVIICAPLLFACGGKREKIKSTVSPGLVSLHEGNNHYAAIDTKQSSVEYKGSNLHGSHSGYVTISKGELLIEDGQLTGGSAEIDMKSIADENHQGKSGVVEHLKSADFFDVEKFPTATVTITKVTPGNAEDKQITANLTIKGITHEVLFPANVVVKDGLVQATAKFAIDRTKWNIRYGSGNFLDPLKDNVISNNIEFTITIVAQL